MPNVFVETTWVVDCFAPIHNVVPEARNLLMRAERGEIRLFLPSICITEARYPLRNKFQPRTEANRIRQFVAWATAEQTITVEQGQTVRLCLDRMEAAVRHDIRVRVYGDTAILTARQTTKGSYKGRDTSGTFHRLRVLRQAARSVARCGAANNAGSKG